MSIFHSLSLSIFILIVVFASSIVVLCFLFLSGCVREAPHGLYGWDFHCLRCHCLDRSLHFSGIHCAISMMKRLNKGLNQLKKL
ncbi:hypothetical protein HN51_045015, partial [Arachis hypogaea]